MIFESASSLRVQQTEIMNQFTYKCVFKIVLAIPVTLYFRLVNSRLASQWLYTGCSVKMVHNQTANSLGKSIAVWQKLA